MNISWFNACLWLTTIQVAVGHPLPKPCWTWPLRKPWSLCISSRGPLPVPLPWPQRSRSGTNWNWTAAVALPNNWQRCPTTAVTAAKATAAWQRFWLFSASSVHLVFQASLKHNLILPNALMSPGSLRIGKSGLVTIGIFKPYPTILPYGENSQNLSSATILSSRINIPTTRYKHLGNNHPKNSPM